MKFKEDKPASFYKTIILGMIFVIVNILLDTLLLTSEFKSENKSWCWTIEILSKLFSSVGLALIVSFITANIKKNEEVMKILSKTNKKEVATELAKQDNEMDEYKSLLIDEIFELPLRFRTNVNVNMTAYLDKKCGQVKVEVLMDFIEYGQNKEKTLLTCFDNGRDYVEYYNVIDTDNANNSEKITSISSRKLKAHGSSFNYEYYVEIPSEFINKKMLKVEKKYCIIGYDHWINTGIIFALPAKNVNITLNLKDGLIIRQDTIIAKENVFSRNYYPEVNPSSYKLSTNGWISHLDGVIFVIAKDDKILSTSTADDSEN